MTGSASSSVPVVISELICPFCHAHHTETMPIDACIYLFDCSACGSILKPKPGDCCVFCSYGSVQCPSVQLARAEGSDALGCCG